MIPVSAQRGADRAAHIKAKTSLCGNREALNAIRGVPARVGLALRVVLFAAAAALVWPATALAGPPYVTDDPAPTDYGHWEIYNFVGGAHVADSTAGQTGLDLNYGAAPDVQLTLVIPAAYDSAGGDHFGMGTVEIAVKYQVLHQIGGGLRPDLAIFPRVFAPTAPDRFGSGRWGLLLPLWAQKDFGKWQLFGGGGYQINSGPGDRDFWTGGLAVQRAVSDRLSLGAEVYGRSREADDARSFTGVSLGAAYKLVEHWSLLVAGGPGIQNAREGGRYVFYLALKADY